MLKYVRSPKRSAAKISDPNQFGNGYYQAAERVDDVESVENMNHKTYQASNAKNFPEQTDISCRDIESDLEGISVSSVSDLSGCSIDLSEHDLTAKAVWSRHTQINSELNQAKERIRVREAKESGKLSSSYPGQVIEVNNDQNNSIYSEKPSENKTVQQKHVNNDQNNSEKLAENNPIQQKNETGKKNSSSSSSSSSDQINEIRTHQSNNNIDKNKKQKAVSGEFDNSSKDSKKMCGLGKRKWLMMGGFGIVFILILVLIILAVKVGQVQETVQYIEDIFIDNITFADTFSRFDME